MQAGLLIHHKAVLFVCAFLPSIFLYGALNPALKADDAEDLKKVVTTPSAKEIASYLETDEKNEVSIEEAKGFRVVKLRREGRVVNFFCFPDYLRCDCKVIQPKLSESVTSKLVNEWNQSNLGMGCVYLNDDGDATMTFGLLTKGGVTKETIVTYVTVAYMKSGQFVKEFSKK